ncbi:MAG: hypothetical protein K6U14_01450 [Firmicutes bacterium]|nr:hypothetical protein [Alicyclobacillaceae bacterium]MCL6496285.1 hypothetical protein [Bacillota bacterium]
MGPALADPYWHRRIHLATTAEGEAWTEAMAQAIREASPALRAEVASAALAHWRERVLAHAETEEAAWAQSPAWAGFPHAALSAQHRAIAEGVDRLADSLENADWEAVLALLQDLDALFRRHADDEEAALWAWPHARHPRPAPASECPEPDAGSGVAGLGLSARPPIRLLEDRP